MKQPVMLRVRFPFESAHTNVLNQIEKFETFFYSIFLPLSDHKETLGLEIVQIRGIMNFYMIAPNVLVATVRSFFYALFPDASLEAMDDYDQLSRLPSQAVGFQVQLKGSEAFSLRSARTMSADPLNAFFNVLGQIPATDAVFFQLILRTVDESLTGEGTRASGLYGFAEKQEIQVVKPKFNTTIRILYFPNNASHIDMHNASFESIFSPFSTEQLQIVVKTAPAVQTAVDAYFSHSEQPTGVFNTDEIAALFHAPDAASKISGVNWLYSRRAEPPMHLPSTENTPTQDISIFGVTNFRGQQMEFGIKREDRRRHLYVVGKSGTGKSKLLEKLIADDIKMHKGVCVIDPHGDLVQAVLAHVPERRISDLVLFSPADLDYPIAFNPVANVSREFKQQTTQGLIEVFKKFFGADWSPKIEHVFRFTVLALLDYPKATIMGIQKMLTDRAYRQQVITVIQDHVVKKFWANEFSSWSEKFDNEAIVPLVNKLGQFLSNEMVRNIVAQSKNKVDLEEIMNNEKILLVELSKGKLGEENAALLGSLIITKIEQAAMARAFLSAEKRKDFYLYVDEFQNFATKTFDNILSEARKYRLNLTISHQYLGQLLASTRETVFGNVGSLITLRMGADDANYIANEFAPRFSGYDIINLGIREMYLKMSIDGVVTPAFSAKTIDVPDPVFPAELRQKMMTASRTKYATPTTDVEKEIAEMDKIGNGSNTHTTNANASDEEGDFEEPLV
ncbi:MAG: hypothetical protein A3G01_00160 [Candidatus Kerfeldbacteria bacterium RIFCSPLOWO2_12_FULL_43_9]|nr:MAG: hypothetical protein A3G01_00160 [Candidatus Kerfeldbacteria bacterium RIFCSPLOWO2_12_FULL_43_9]